MNVLSIDVTWMDPLPNEVTTMPRRLAVLRPSDGAVYDAYRSRASSYVPRIISRRYHSDSRVARAVSTFFTDEFSLALTDGLWGTRCREIVGNDNEWYCLSLRLGGDTVETVNGVDHRLGGYSCYLVRYARGMTHELRSVTDEPMQEACIMFRPALLAEKLGISRDDLIRLLHPGSDPWYSECRMTPEMAAIIRDLRRLGPSEPTYRLVAEAKTLELLALYIRRLEDEARAPRRMPAFSGELGRLHRVRLHLEQNYRREPRIDELCAIAEMGRKALTTAFKREFGATVQEHHRATRMGVAKALLQDDTMSVLSVAERVGYAYPGNFAKAFLKQIGVSPRDYRSHLPS